MDRIPLLATAIGEIKNKQLDGLVFESINPCGDWSTPDAISLQGVLLNGSYREVLRLLPNCKGMAKAAIAIFAHGSGMEAFLEGFAQLLPGVILVGGAAARGDAAERGVILPACEDVALLLITEDDWNVETVLFHRPTGLKFWAEGEELRRFEQVTGRSGKQDAVAFVEAAARQHGVTEAIWDRASLLTSDGRLLHMNSDGQTLHVSANLDAARYLELAVFDENYGRAKLADQIPASGFVFGCAGLNGLITGERPWEAKLNTCYLYGEVVGSEGKPAFVNLSMVILSPKL